MKKTLLSMLSVLVLIFSLTIFSCSNNKENLVFLGREEIVGKVSHITRGGFKNGINVPTTIYAQNPKSTTMVKCSNKFGENYEIGDDIIIFVVKYKEISK